MTFGPVSKRDPSFKMRPTPGTRVRFTDAFISAVPFASTQRGLRWTVIPCPCKLCRLGKHVAVNEPPPNDPMYDDVPFELRPKWRHINWRNLQQVYDTTDHAPETPRQPR